MKSSDAIFGLGAVAPTLVNEVTLLGRGANAATIAAEGGTAALGLALVVLEHEEAVITRLELGASERLIRGSVAPAGRVARLQADAIKSTHHLVRIARATTVGQRVRREALNLSILEARKIGAAGILETLLVSTGVLETLLVSTGILEAIQIRHAERADIHHQKVSREQKHKSAYQNTCAHFFFRATFF
jgi:hypothetical protein